MHSVKKLTACFVVLLLAFTASAEAAPKNHAELMKNEDYKNPEAVA